MLKYDKEVRMSSPHTERTEYQEEDPQDKKVSRRAFLTKTGIGLGIAAGALSLGGGKLFAAQGRSSGTADKLPWGYAPLDPERVRKLGHQNYYEGACAYGAFTALLHELQDKVGGPYRNIPSQLLKYGHGGIAGWGTVCGALNGAAAVINMAFASKHADTIISELFGWYSTTALPTDKANRYAVQGEYLVSDLKSDKRLPKSVSNSPLCHVSASVWAKEADVKIDSSERSERCGRLTGDTAARAVELMNAFHKGTFTPVYAVSNTTEGCLYCHSGHIKGAKQECLECHEKHD